MTSPADSLYKYLDSKESQMMAFLETLVNIDSGSYDKPGIDKVINIMNARLEQLGFDTEIVELEESGNHVVGRKRGSSDKILLLLGHCDTVFPQGTASERPFHIDGNRAYGPGVADMKGGLTVMMGALDALKAEMPEVWDELGLVVVVNSDEEISSRTSRHVIEQEARRADAICVLEPARPGGEYVTQRKGHGTYHLRVTGKSAHAGVAPEQGASAIHELFQKGLALQALNDSAPGLKVNIGVTRGGMRPNVVADSAEAEIDVRIQTTEDIERIETAFRNVVSEQGIPGTHTELTGGIEFPPMLRTESSLRLFELVRLAGAEIGLSLDHIATGGASDGSYASQYAPTCDGMGPQGGAFHSPNEYIEIPSLVQRTKVLARFVTLWHASAE
jgi:glutamate carboxypeptidase